MAISLYAAFVPSALQMLRALSAITEKAEEYCAASGAEPEALILARLAEDMLPFSYQVKSVAVHSAGAIAGVRAGVFSPDMTPLPKTFPDMRARLDEALQALDGESEASMEALMGRLVDFTINDKVLLSFTAENFLLSFSQPNFYFHAATAYDLLRMKGVPLGKVDYLGQMRIIAPTEAA